ncbi:MAG: hypothetical protein PHF97_12320, partial [Bacteroidales bacterium]|nr:hypothetical protein [Bacteroidales bacterium]
RPFLPKTGWVSAGMAHFSDEKIDTVDWIFYRNQWVGMLRFIQFIYKPDHSVSVSSIIARLNGTKRFHL